MALSNYVDLQASVASWMNRTDLGSVIPDFISIAESRIARDLRLRKQFTSGTLTTVAGTRSVSLPSGWLEFSNLTLATSPYSLLQVTTTEHLNAQYPDDGWTGVPILCAIEGDSLLLGPVPDAAYTVNVDYFTRFPDLASNSTNWLLTNYPNVYLSACLAQGCLFTLDKTGAAEWNAVYKSEIAEVQRYDDEAVHSGSVLRVKAV